MNTNLHKAKKSKNDEFYTQIEDINAEMKHYEQHFKGKTIFMNCDNPKYSNFWIYFHTEFTRLGLKKIISTHYAESTYKFEYEGGNDIDYTVGSKTNLIGDGDFRSEECIEIMKEADILITNQPFSLFRDYVKLAMSYNKKFIIIGTLNVVKYNDIFPLLKENKVWLGVNDGNMEFKVPSNSEPHKTRYWVDETGQKWRSLGNTIWLTNLYIQKRYEKLNLTKYYNPIDYPIYDNYDAIDCSKVANIPLDTDKVIGVPITFFTKYNPEQFEIVGKLNNGEINGIKIYARILIHKK